MHPIKLSTNYFASLVFTWLGNLVTKSGCQNISNLTINLCWVNITPHSFHSGGLLSIDSLTKGLLVVAKLFKTTMVLFLQNWSIWFGFKNIN